MKGPKIKKMDCLGLLSIIGVLLTLLLMSTVGIGYSVHASDMTNTNNTVGARGTELMLTNTTGDLLTNGSFDGTSEEGARIIDYHNVEVNGTTTYVLDSADLHFGHGNIITSSTSDVADVTLLCNAEFEIYSAGTSFTGIAYHFVLIDGAGMETAIPPAGLSTTISDLNGKTLSIMIDGLSEDPPENECLTFTINVSYAGTHNVVTNYGNQLSFREAVSDVVIDTTIPGDPDNTPVAAVNPTVITSGGVEYPAYEIDYTANTQTGWTSFDATLSGSFCFKFDLQKSITITTGGYSYHVSSGASYYSFIDGTTYSSKTIDGITWMSSDEPITFTIHKNDANAGVFMTAIYPE